MVEYTGFRCEHFDWFNFSGVFTVLTPYNPMSGIPIQAVVVDVTIAPFVLLGLEGRDAFTDHRKIKDPDAFLWLQKLCFRDLLDLSIVLPAFQTVDG